MTRTGKTPIVTVAASGAGDHVKGANPTHDHDNAETDAAIAAAIKAHEDAKHGGTVPPPTDNPPTISGLAVSAVSAADARVSWSLSEPSTGQVEYGTTSGYGSLSSLEPNLLTSHSQAITGLAADTTYHFRVKSKDAAGQEVKSADASFKTAAVVAPPPGKTITVPKGARGYVAKAGEVIDGWTVTGPGDATFDYSTIGIYVNVPNVTIRNCTISGMGFCGIYTEVGTTNLLVEGNTISHCCYAGVLVKTTTKSAIKGNKIDHIGTAGHQTPDCNAYGIVPTMETGGVPSSDILIDGNTITDVPLWHGIDTHGAQRMTVSNNIIRRTARAIFITSQSETDVPRDCVITGNDLGEPQSNIPAGGTDANSAITLYKSMNTIVDNNKTGAYATQINNISNLSTYAHPPTGNHA